MKKPTRASDNGPAASDDNDTNNADPNGNKKPGDPIKKKKKPGKPGKPPLPDKVPWVTVFWCFHCGKQGYHLPKCKQCEQAYYCNADCQRKHWRKHKPVCRAAVAALARHAHRERLARAVREKGKDKVEGAEEDALCVICQAKPVDPVEVGVCACVLCSDQELYFLDVLGGRLI